MLRAQQEMQRGMLEMIARISQPPAGSMVDNRGIGKPSSFRGEEGKYHEWKTKLVAYLKVTNPRAPDWLRWATTQTEAVSEDDLEIMFQNTDAYAELGDMKLFSFHEAPRDLGLDHRGRRISHRGQCSWLQWVGIIPSLDKTV